MATAIVSKSKPHKWFSPNSFFKRKPRPQKLAKVPTLTRREEYERVFRHFDANGDGKISSEELRAYFASIGEACELGGGDECWLDLEGFVGLMERDGGEGEGEDLRRAFEMFEADKGCGFITPKGLQRMLSQLGDSRSHQECVAMIGAFDLDGNGLLDFHEFVRMMTAN